MSEFYVGKAYIETELNPGQADIGSTRTQLASGYTGDRIRELSFC